MIDAAVAGRERRRVGPPGVSPADPGCGRGWARGAVDRAGGAGYARGRCAQVNPLTLEDAAYIFVATNVPETIASDLQVLQLYRLRWPIELAFNRLKSILQFDALRAKDPELARTYLLGKLLGALIVDELTVRAQLFAPWGFTLR